MGDLGHYDDYRMPPNWLMAKDHGQAVKVGVPPHLNNGKKPKHFADDVICPCCFKYIQKEEIPLCEDTKDLAFLGVGFPLFYNFMRLCLLLLASLIIDSCVMSIVMNLTENECNKSHSQHSLITIKCQGDLLLKLSYVDTKPPSVYRQTLKILSFLVSLIVIVYIRKQQMHMADYLDERNTLIGQFTFIIENVPLGERHNKELLRRMIEDLELEEALEVKEILLIEDLSDFLAKKKEIDAVNKKKKRVLTQQQLDQEQLQAIEREYKSTQEQLNHLKQFMANNEETYFIGMAIVVMNTENNKIKAMKQIRCFSEEYVRRFYPNYNIKKSKLKVRQAPPPADIIWENIHYSKSTRGCALVGGWLISLLVLVIATVTVFFIIKKKSQLIDLASSQHDQHLAATDQALGEFMSYFMVVMVSVFNKFIMSTIFHSICDIEKHESHSNLQFSFALKYMLGMFFTTALMTLAVEAIIFHNYDHHGVVFEEILMAVFSAFFSPLVYLINPAYIIKWIKKKVKYGKQNMTQAQANSVMEFPEYDLGKRYAEIMKQLWFTMLYTWLIPIAPIISFIGIILYYLVDKYVLLRRSSVKQTISLDLSRKIFTLVQFSLVLQPIGQIIFDKQIRGIYSFSSFGMLAVALLYLVLPSDRIIDCLFHQNFIPEKLTYDEAKIYFEHFYQACYPVRRTEAIKEIIDEAKGCEQHHRVVRDYMNITSYTEKTDVRIQTTGKLASHPRLSNINNGELASIKTISKPY